MSRQPEAKQACAKCQFVKPLSAFDRAPDCPSGRRKTCRRCKKRLAPMSHGGSKALPPEEAPKRFFRALDSKRYIITSAQNATPVHEALFRTLLVAAKHLNAELVVIPLRYKNPTSIWSNKMANEDWWAKETLPYLHNVRKKLNPNLVLLADVKTQPTASSPLTGFESMTGAESCIVGHPKMQFKSVPVPTGRFPKILTTTGACTHRNYTDTKQGKIGAFHHFLGAIIVEISGKKFHLRQLNADREDGSFIDKDKLYTEHGVEDAPPAELLALGDIHAKFIDPDVERATWGAGGIVDTLKPKRLAWHDTDDNYASNPHHRGNPFIAQAKYRAKFGTVRDELEHAVKFVREHTPAGCESVIVASNHDDFLARWMMDSTHANDPANAEFYHETALAMHRSARLTGEGAKYADPFTYWVNQLKGDANILCLDIDEDFQVMGIECGLHGHRGPNGAKGTLQNLSRLGSKVISGHTHTPGIEEGHYQLGTSTRRRLEYTHGPGSWLNAHCVVYANGKRSLLIIVEGEWTL